MEPSESILLDNANRVVNYPVGWYPICLSSEVPQKKKYSLRAFGREWVVFRNISGEVFCVQRHCPHMGVDLMQGKVDEKLVCPLHKKAFPEINCDRTRDGLPLSLIVKEDAGIVYVFLGKSQEAKFPLKTGDWLRSKISTFNYPSPFQMVGLNGFDTHHLEAVHCRSLTAEPKVKIIDNLTMSINYQAKINGNSLRDKINRFLKIDSVDIVISCTGGSILTFEHKKIGVTTYLCLLPVEQNQTRIFLTSFFIERKKTILNKMFLCFVHNFIIKFLKEDFGALWNSRYKPEGMMEPKDHWSIVWNEHFQAIPKMSVVIEEKS